MSITIKFFQNVSVRGTLLVLAMMPLACLLSGCNGDGSGDTAGNSDKLTVAVVPKSTGGEFWETVEQGANDAAKELGVNLKWEGTLTETEIAEQNKIIENMINLGVDGLALAPLNAKANAKTAHSAIDAGIPVVVFDSALDSDKQVAFVATDNVAGGGIAGKFITENLEGGKKKILVLRYVQGTASTENRAKGFMDAVGGAGFEVVADPFCEDGTVAGAKKTASNTLEGFVNDNVLELDGIFACNLYATLGMAEALDDLRKSNIAVNAKFVGFDSSPKLITELQAGKIDALVSQDPKRMGYLAVETVVKHLKGEPVEAAVDTGVELVTKQRLENEPAIRKLVGLKE